MTVATDLATNAAARRRLYLKIDGLKEILWQDVRVPGPSGEAVDDDPPGAHCVRYDTVALWRMDEYLNTANLADAGPFALNATPAAGAEPAIITTGQFGNCRNFNASNRRATVADAIALRPQRLTIAAWIYPTDSSQGANATIVHKKYGASTSSYSFQMTGSAVKPGLSLRFTDASTSTAYASTALSTNTWHHVASTWDGSTIRTYCDGVLVTSTSVGAKTIDYAAQQLCIGNQTDSTSSNYFRGYIDDLVIYSDARSTEWVRRTYASGAGYDRPGVVCLKAPSAEYTTALDLAEMKADPSAMSIDLYNIPDPAAPTTYWLAKLFAPGRWESASQARTWLRRADYTTAVLLPTDTTIYCQSVTGFATSGEAHLASEVFSYTDATTAVHSGGETIGKFTGVTRGIWPCIGASWSIAQRYAEMDGSPGGQGVNLPVSSVPYSWVGRRVALYVTTWDESACKWNAASGAVLLWVGAISDGIFFDSGEGLWRLSCEHIAKLLDKQVMAEQPVGQLARINLGTGYGRSFAAFVHEDATGILVAHQYVTITGGTYEGPDALGSAICEALNNRAAWTEYYAPLWTWGVRTEIGRTDEGKYVLRADLANTGMRLTLMAYPDFCHALNAIGLDPHPTRNNTLRTTDMRIATLELDGVYQTYHPLRRQLNGGTLWCGQPSGPSGWADQGDNLLQSRSFVMAKGAILEHSIGRGSDVKKGVYLEAVTDGSAVPLTLDTTHIPQQYAADQWIGQRIDQADPVTFQWVYVPTVVPPRGTPRGPFELLLYPLLSTGGQDGSNSLLYDRAPMACSVGMQASLVNVQSFKDADMEVMGVASDLAVRDRYILHKAIPWRELFQREAKLFGYFIAWDGGQLTVKSATRIQYGLRTATIGETQRAQWIERPTVESTVGTVVNQWSLKFGYDYQADKPGPETIIKDLASSLGLQTIKATEIQHPGVLVSDTASLTSRITRLSDFFARRAVLTRLPYQVVKVSLAPTLVDQIYVGDVVQYTSSNHPDPYGNGTMTASALAIVLEVGWSAAEWKGHATLMLNSAFDATAIKPWAPAALVDKGASNGGWSSGNYRLTLRPLVFGVSGDSDDGARFASGDKVLIVERAPSDPTNPQAWSATVASAYETNGANILTLSAVTLTGWDATREYVVVPDDYTTATSAQKAAHSYQASTSTGKFSNGDTAHRWG